MPENCNEREDERTGRGLKELTSYHALSVLGKLDRKWLRSKRANGYADEEVRRIC